MLDSQVRLIAQVCGNDRNLLVNLNTEYNYLIGKILYTYIRMYVHNMCTMYAYLKQIPVAIKTHGNELQGQAK